MLITYMETEPPHNQQPRQLTFEEIPTGNILPATHNFKPHPRTINVPTENITDTAMTQLVNKLSVFYAKALPIANAYQEIDMRTMYTHFTIPKASGGERPIDAPNPQLKQNLTELRLQLSSMGILAHTAAYAYVPGRCAKDAVERHQRTEHKYYLKLDLHNFFGSCSENFIKHQLNQIYYFAQLPSLIIDKILHMAMLNGSLPQGSPLSPWLTNQIMLPFDFELTNWCKQHNITYTRYADDMLFSANFDPKTLVEAKVTKLLRDTPLTLNTDKTHLTTINGRNWNLGIMTNKENHMTIGYKKKEIARAMLVEFCKNKDTWNAQQAQELLGNFAYFTSIEPEYFQNLLTKYSNKFNVDISTELKRISKTR